MDFENKFVDIIYWLNQNFSNGDMSIWLDNVIKELVIVLFMFVIFQCLRGYFGSVLFLQHGDMSIC